MSAKATMRPDVGEFFLALYGEDCPGYLNIWTREDKKSRWFADPYKAAKAAVNLSKNYNVYFGLGRQPNDLGADVRGKGNSVLVIPGMWADLDVKGPAHREPNLPPTLAEALSLAHNFPLPPTLVIDSGHGAQVYWLFKKPLKFETPEAGTDAQDLCRSFQATLKVNAMGNGWTIDTTSDLARVLRPPGTVNRKPGLPPARVTVLEYHPERRYEPEDFKPHLVDFPRTRRARPNQEGDFSLPLFVPIFEGCAWLKHCLNDAPSLSEPAWYAMLGIVGRCEGGPAMVHQMSEPYPDYSPAETDAKLAHALNDAGPRTCEDIRISLDGEQFCDECQHWGNIRSPIVLDRKEAWEPPTPFLHAEAPEFPTEVLPQWLRDYVEAEATATQTPPDLAGMLALSTLSASCAKKVVVQVRAGWEEPVNIYTVTALPPANRKTAVFADIAAPIEEYEKSETERMTAEIAKAESEYQVAKSRLEHVQRQAARAKPDDAAGLASEASILAQELTLMAVPAMPRLIVDDCTPEKLGTLLRDHGGRMAVLSAEGDVFDLMAGRYSERGANFGVYLKAHAGDTLRVDRVIRSPEFVKNPALTMGLAVQPEVIRGLATHREFRGRGLLGRFLYSWPQSLLGRRDVNPTSVPEAVKRTYFDAILKLLALPFGASNNGEVVPHVVRLAPAAGQEFQRFMAWIEPQLGEFGELATMPDWGGKLAGAVVRVAGLLHMAHHHASPSPWQYTIEPATMEAAIRLGHYFIAHARLSFAEMGSDETVAHSRHVLRWIEKTQLEMFTKREAHRQMQGRFRRAEDLEPALKLLMAHGYIRERQHDDRQGAGRKPSPSFEVNPVFFERARATSVNKVNSVTKGEADILDGTYLADESADTQRGWPDTSDTIDTIDTAEEPSGIRENNMLDRVEV